MCALRTRSCAFGGERWCTRAATSRTTPAMPAAGSAWPALALKLPRGSAAHSERSSRIAEITDRTSIGSPSGVPVPWAS
eukprot:scaffold330178_cov97-Tisochrysis_lutea.AAC.1